MQTTLRSKFTLKSRKKAVEKVIEIRKKRKKNVEK